MAFRSVNLNPPRGPRGGGGGGRGGNGGGFGGGSGPGYNTPQSTYTIDASGRVDQGFGPVGGVSAAADDFDIFGIDDPATLQSQQPNQPPPAPIL